MSTEAWYILYDGSSPDGMGCSSFILRTLDKEIAMRHAYKCADDPYCTGYTLVVTDTTVYRMQVVKKGRKLIEY